MNPDFTSLAVALGVGLLMGVERERRKGSGSDRRFAGVRTFTLTALAGALAQLSGVAGLVLAGGTLVAGLAVVAYLRDRSDDPGVTTEVALFLVFLIGVTAVNSPTLAAAVGAVAVILLAAREHLHRFSTDWLTQVELRDALILTGLALVLLPLVPDRPLAGDFLNPQMVLKLLVLLLALQAVGHVAQRILGIQHGLLVAGVASGFVSSTATIAAMAARARRQPAELPACARAAVASNLSTMVQLLLVAAMVQPMSLRALWLPAFCGVAVVLIFTAVGARAVPASPLVGAQPASAAISLKEAAVIAAILSAVQLAAQGLKAAFGEAGLVAAAALAGFIDVHAAAAAVLAQPLNQQGVPGQMLLPLLVALVTNMISKLVVAAAAGGVPFLMRVAPALLAMTLAFAAALVVGPTLAAR